MKSLLTFGFLVSLAPTLACAQTVQTFTIDPHPSGKPAGAPSALTIAFEKSVGFFTSTTIPSVVVGMGSGGGDEGGLYLYTSSSGELSGPWVRTPIDPVGDFYERTATLLYPGDTYPGVVASRSGQVVWYHNPMNRGGDPTQPWESSIINPNGGCHDLHIADVDQDGLPDVVCSAALMQRTQSFIAFQNDRDHWKIVEDPFRIGVSIARAGDGIDLISISGGPRINVVSGSESGVYWFRNPKLTEGDPRRDPWPGSYVGAGNEGVALATGVFNGSGDGIVVASGEPVPKQWDGGLVWYEQPPNPRQPWIVHSIDPTYRAVHQINTGNLNGTPYFIVAEQEQVCGTPTWPAEHPGIPCRVTMFQFENGSFSPFLISDQGTHNQAVIPYNGGLLVVGANHGVYGTRYPAVQAWFIRAGE